MWLLNNLSYTRDLCVRLAGYFDTMYDAMLHSTGLIRHRHCAISRCISGELTGSATRDGAGSRLWSLARSRPRSSTKSCPLRAGGGCSAGRGTEELAAAPPQTLSLTHLGGVWPRFDLHCHLPFLRLLLDFL